MAHFPGPWHRETQYRHPDGVSQVTTPLASLLCRLDALPAQGVTEISAQLDDGPASLIVGRQGQGAVAYLNICPHAGRSLSWAPGRFLIENGLLICAAHGASFTLQDGLCVLGPCRGASLQAVPVEVRDGEVHIAAERPAAPG